MASTQSRSLLWTAFPQPNTRNLRKGSFPVCLQGIICSINKGLLWIRDPVFLILVLLVAHGTKSRCLTNNWWKNISVNESTLISIRDSSVTILVWGLKRWGNKRVGRNWPPFAKGNWQLTSAKEVFWNSYSNVYFKGIKRLSVKRSRTGFSWDEVLVCCKHATSLGKDDRGFKKNCGEPEPRRSVEIYTWETSKSSDWKLLTWRVRTSGQIERGLHSKSLSEQRMQECLPGIRF